MYTILSSTTQRFLLLKVYLMIFIKWLLGKCDSWLYRLFNRLFISALILLIWYIFEKSRLALNEISFMSEWFSRLITQLYYDIVLIGHKLYLSSWAMVTQAPPFELINGSALFALLLLTSTSEKCW